MERNISDVWIKARSDADEQINQNRKERRDRQDKWIKRTKDYPVLLPQAEKAMNEHTQRIGQWTDGNIVDCWEDDEGFLTVKYEGGRRYAYGYDTDGYLIYWEMPYK